ncbi:MAG: hypothetical protein R6X06_09325 [Gammaproteobacteria bacterium]
MEFLSLQQTAGKILRLTQAMRKLAEAQSWQEFARLETERQRSLEYLFKHPDISTALQDVAETLHQVIQLDQESIALGEAAKRLLAEKLNLQTPAVGAIKAYKNTSNLG